MKTFEIDDDRKLFVTEDYFWIRCLNAYYLIRRIFYEKRLGAEVAADSLGDEFSGYILKITGGNDKQGFPMMQGVLVPNRVRLLLSKGTSFYGGISRKPA